MNDYWEYPDIAGILGTPVEEATLSINAGPYERPLGQVLRQYPDGDCYSDSWTCVHDFLGNFIETPLIKK